MSTAITTARVLYLAELQDRPSKILDAVITAWLGDGPSAPGDAPPWTAIQAETLRLLKRALPGWWFLIGHTVDGGVEFTVEPLPDGPAAHLWDIEGVDPVIRAFAIADNKHLCVAMVEAIFRARLLAETHQGSAVEGQR